MEKQFEHKEANTQCQSCTLFDNWIYIEKRIVYFGECSELKLCQENPLDETALGFVLAKIWETWEITSTLS